MGENYKTPLITAAIRMAAANHALPEGAVFHSDRGSNYTSDEYAVVLGELGINGRSDGPGYATIMPCLNRSTGL
jgi:transposase InsO family protein